MTKYGVEEKPVEYEENSIPSNDRVSINEFGDKFDNNLGNSMTQIKMEGRTR